MKANPLIRRLTALGALIAAVGLIGFTGNSMARSFMDGQREIAEKQRQLRALRELAAARTAFDRLKPRNGGTALVLPADADPTAILQGAVNRAADGQQVIVDGLDALPPEPVTRSAMVHLRGTQAGLYVFLKSIEDTTPYLLVPRLEITPSRSADPDHGKPFVVSADLRISVLTAPAVPNRRKTPPADPALP